MLAKVLVNVPTHTSMTASYTPSHTSKVLNDRETITIDNVYTFILEYSVLISEMSR